MSYIGAKDRIDNLLIKKYANTITNNLKDVVALPADQVLQFMNHVARYDQAIRQMSSPIKAGSQQQKQSRDQGSSSKKDEEKNKNEEEKK